MSALSNENIAVMVRQELRLPPEAALDLQPLIGPALNALGEDVAADYKLRPWLTTDPATATATLGAGGAADLSTLITTNNILLESIRYGSVYHSSSVFPLQWLEQTNAGRVKSEFATIFLACWLQGTTLYTRSANNNASSYLTGDLSLAVPFIPTLATLPESLTDELVQKIVDMVRGSMRADAA